MGAITSRRELLSALRRQAWLILLILAVGLPAVYVYAKTRPHVFEGKGTLGIELPQGLDDGGASAGGLALSRRLDEIEQALQSRETLLAFGDRFGLYPGGSDESRVGKLRSALWINRLVDPGQTWNPSVLPYGIEVYAKAGDPDTAADFANAVLDQAVKEDEARVREDMDAALQRQRLALDYLVERQNELETQMDAAQAELAQLRAANPDSLPDGLEAQRTRLAALQDQFEGVQREFRNFESSQGQLSADLADRRRAQLQEQLSAIGAEIERSETAIAAAPAVERQLAEINLRIRSLDAELGAIASQRTQAELNQKLGDVGQTARLYVLEAAVPPDVPISRSRSRLAMTGGVVVLLLALAVGLGREMIHPGIRSASQMKAQLGIEPVVVIPYVNAAGVARWRMGGALLFGGVVLLLLLGWA